MFVDSIIALALAVIVVTAFGLTGVAAFIFANGIYVSVVGAAVLLGRHDAKQID